MKSRLVAIMLASGALALSGAALAGDPAAGKVKAEACLDCHEPAEDFEGMSADEIAAKMAEHRIPRISVSIDFPTAAEHDEFRRSLAIQSRTSRRPAKTPTRTRTSAR